MDEWKEPHPRRLPSLEEISSTRTSISELDNELNDLHSQISRLETRMAVLEKERANRVSFIAPFRRLPQELLANIAKICIRGGDSPNNLNQICHSFRTAVNSINHAWSTIHLVPRKQAQRTSFHAQKVGHFVDTLEHLQSLLERAAGTPIDLSITHPDDTMQDMIQLATSHSQYIRSLAIVLDHPDFHLPVMDLPLLENFQVHSQSMNEAVEESLKMIDGRAPELRSLCFEIHSSSNLPLTEVARLQCFYRLHSLYFATGSRGPTDVSAPVLDLPELKTLTILGKPWILAYMTLPKLETLVILAGMKKRNHKVNPSHFPTSITRLHLDHVRFTMSTESAVLLPNLTHMDLRYPSIEVLDAHFRLPALQTMRMDSITYNGLFRPSPEQSALSAVFSGEGIFRDMFSLHRLLLEEIHLETTPCSVFRGIPALREWELRGCSLPHDLVETLTGKANVEERLFFRLERLHVERAWSMADAITNVEKSVLEVGSSRPTLKITFRDSQKDG